MNDGIYLIGENEELHEINLQPYDSEALLQELLAKYPKLLGKRSDCNTESLRWLLIAREMGIPNGEVGEGRWSIDHLFLDQHAIPTLVEVKRSTDTRIRREVVGQMLDYAANAVIYWPIDKIQEAFFRTCEIKGTEPTAELERFLGSTTNPDEFWQTVKTNLQAGKIRMIFVADEIPSELRRIVEFLNEQMDPAEVLSVEIKQYQGSDVKLMVSNLIGQTTQARQRKQSGITRSPRSNRLSAKDFIRKQVAETGSFRLEEGLEAGYSLSNLETCISDLKNPRYCGNGGILVLEKSSDGTYLPKK